MPFMVYRILILSVVLVCALMVVPFFTLYERKLLRLSHLRLGPNVVGWTGLLQPFSDAIKLFCKENIKPAKRNPYGIILCPILTVGVGLASWSIIPWPSGLFSSGVIILVGLVLISLRGVLHLSVG